MFSFYSQQDSEKAKGALCHSDRPKVIEHIRLRPYLEINCSPAKVRLVFVDVCCRWWGQCASTLTLYKLSSNQPATQMISQITQTQPLPCGVSSLEPALSLQVPCLKDVPGGIMTHLPCSVFWGGSGVVKISVFCLIASWDDIIPISFLKARRPAELAFCSSWNGMVVVFKREVKPKRYFFAPNHFNKSFMIVNLVIHNILWL